MEDFLIYIAQYSICLSIFGLVYLLFLRKQTFFRFNRVFLLSGVLLSSFLPFIVFTYDVPIPTSTTSFDWAMIPISEATIEEAPAISLWQIISAIYFIGIAVLAIRHITMLLKLRELKNTGNISTQKGYSLIDNKEIKTPFSMMNSIFINSTKMQEKEREIVLKHEISHIQQKHWLDLLCSECALLLQWFNPLVWYYIHLQKENHEYLADQSVLQNGESTAVYRAVLINQRFQGPVFSFTNSFNYSNPQNRLNMMKKMKTSPWKKIAILTVLPLLGVFFALSAKPNYVVQEAQTVTITEDSVLIITPPFIINGLTMSDSNPLVIEEGETDMTGEELQKLDSNINHASLSALVKANGLGKKSLIVVDGREKRGTLDNIEKQLDFKSIIGFTILKGKDANDKYGKKGKDGVLEIETEKSEAKEVTVIAKSTANAQLSAEEIAQINRDVQKLIADLDVGAIVAEAMESVNKIGKITDIKDLSKLQGLQSLNKLSALEGLSVLSKLGENDMTPETKLSLESLEQLEALEEGMAQIEKMVKEVDKMAAEIEAKAAALETIEVDKRMSKN